MKLFEILLVVLTLASGLILLRTSCTSPSAAPSAGLLDSEPVLVEYSRAFFPVLAIVLIVRSFVAEPFKIPSSSMMPNLLIGDFILVNKFAYGIRLPITNTKIVPFGEPARRRGGVPLPRHSDNDPGRELHQARDRPAGRHHGLPRRRLFDHRRAAEVRQQGHLRRPQGPGRGRQPAGEHLPGRTHRAGDRLPAWPGPVDGAGRQVLGDGRQPRQQRRQPFLGLAAGGEPARQGLPDLAELQGWFCKDGFEPSRIGSSIN
jgi:signal peptidase I